MSAVPCSERPRRPSSSACPGGAIEESATSQCVQLPGREDGRDGERTSQPTAPRAPCFPIPPLPPDLLISYTIRPFVSSDGPLLMASFLLWVLVLAACSSVGAAAGVAKYKKVSTVPHLPRSAKRQDQQPIVNAPEHVILPGVTVKRGKKRLFKAKFKLNECALLQQHVSISVFLVHRGTGGQTCVIEAFPVQVSAGWAGLGWGVGR